MEANSNMLALTEKESGQYKPTQSHNRTLYPFPISLAHFQTLNPQRCKLKMYMEQ